MALHELATNATKYGALSGDEGEVRLSWSVRHGPPVPGFSLVWEEIGGPRVQPPARRGFGSRLIEEALAQSLGAGIDFDFRQEGLVFRLDAPLSEGVGPVSRD